MTRAENKAFINRVKNHINYIGDMLIQSVTRYADINDAEGTCFFFHLEHEMCHFGQLKHICYTPFEGLSINGHGLPYYCRCRNKVEARQAKEFLKKITEAVDKEILARQNS